ncbi:thermonuclease family protein [Pseudoroseomonas globiformis]|uniref:Thermonuclease family protein n=1 Tax=Teichococcus globiformis TaxID=2307229 RepID=A0ABV7FZ92_9PROT
MPYHRRLFRSAASSRRTSRRWSGAVLGLGAALLALLLVTIGLPANLLGSAPREQAWSAAAETVRVVDGETLRLGDRTLRLAGLITPERGQTCSTEVGVGFDCGAAAAQALSRLVQGRDMECRVQGRDHFGRALALCEAGDRDVNLAMAATGWALAGPEAVPEIRLAEGAARAAARGLWSYPAGAPAAWRVRH